jgi:ADP-ribose pyrophosphatase YjhB (NUDIX family)
VANLRRSARALVVDPDDRLLLGEFDLPHTRLWATPGGGLEVGESPVDALRRELREEVGLRISGDPPPHVWRRTVVIEGAIPGYDGQVEDYFWVLSPPFVPRGDLTDEQLAAEHLVRLRWWTLDELRATDEVLAPRDLAERFAALLRDGPPPAPLAIGT